MGKVFVYLTEKQAEYLEELLRHTQNYSDDSEEMNMCELLLNKLDSALSSLKAGDKDG